MITGVGQRGQAPGELVTGGQRSAPINSGKQDDGTAVRTSASQANATGEGVAVGAPLLTEGACFAGRAFVHRVLKEALLSSEFGTKKWQIQASRSLVAQSIGMLLAGSRAVALLWRAQRNSAHQAGR